MRKPFPLRITTFLVLSHFLIGAVGVGIVANAALYAIFKSGETALVREAEDQAYVIAAMLANTYPPERLAAGEFDAPTLETLRKTIDVHLARRTDVQYTLYRADGKLLITNIPGPGGGGQPSSLPVEVQEALSRPAASAIRSDASGVRRVFVAVPVGSAGAPGAVLQLGIPYFAAMAPTFRTMAVIALVGISIAFVILWVGWRSSIYLSRPVVSLAQVAERISRGDLTARADPQGPLEVIHLAVTLNRMTARLQNTLDTMQTFVANASHELRTPLTGIKLQVGALRAGAVDEPDIAERFLSQIESEVDRLGMLVSDLLDLSQLESGDLGAPQAVDLAELAREVVSFWEARSQQAGLRLTTRSAGGPSLVWGDPYRLRRLLDNLVDNAIKNTPPGGRVEIALGPGHQPGFVRLEVMDTGVGIAWEHQARIFERFYRVEPRRPAGTSTPAGGPASTGSGLGLAIAKTIVSAHGGSIGVHSVPGEGSTFWVELPAAPTRE